MLEAQLLCGRRITGKEERTKETNMNFADCLFFPVSVFKFFNFQISKFSHGQPCSVSVPPQSFSELRAD